MTLREGRERREEGEISGARDRGRGRVCREGRKRKERERGRESMRSYYVTNIMIDMVGWELILSRNCSN